jgi:hypothetical protein
MEPFVSSSSASKCTSAPHDAIEPTQSIYERNPGLDGLNGQSKADAIASSKINWREPDNVPTEQLNQILWRNVMGTYYPIWKQRFSVFHPAGMQ